MQAGRGDNPFNKTIDKVRSREKKTHPSIHPSQRHTLRLPQAQTNLPQTQQTPVCQLGLPPSPCHFWALGDHSSTFQPIAHGNHWTNRRIIWHGRTPYLHPSPHQTSWQSDKNRRSSRCFCLATDKWIVLRNHSVEWHKIHKAYSPITHLPPCQILRQSIKDRLSNQQSKSVPPGRSPSPLPTLRRAHPPLRLMLRMQCMHGRL